MASSCSGRTTSRRCWRVGHAGAGARSAYGHGQLRYNGAARGGRGTRRIRREYSGASIDVHGTYRGRRSASPRRTVPPRRRLGAGGQRRWSCVRRGGRGGSSFGRRGCLFENLSELIGVHSHGPCTLRRHEPHPALEAWPSASSWWRGRAGGGLRPPRQPCRRRGRTSSWRLFYNAPQRYFRGFHLNSRSYATYKKNYFLRRNRPTITYITVVRLKSPPILDDLTRQNRFRKRHSAAPVSSPGDA